MSRIVTAALALFMVLAALPAMAAWHTVSQTSVQAPGHPESVAYDAQDSVLYMSNFGPKFSPTLADKQGFVSRLDMNGKMLVQKYLPGPGQELHKPKGIFVHQGLLWATDIDSVWCFDLKSKKGRRLILPGAVFTNDLVVGNNKLYVSDSTAGKIYLVQPADFLKAEPKVRVMLSPPGFKPNGLCLTPDGTLIIAASSDMGGPGGLMKAKDVGQMEAIKPRLGRLDGVAMLPDGAILFTDWKQQGLFVLEPNGQVNKLAGEFKGPADFALAPQGKGFLVVVPDLVTGQVRFVKIAK